ncbi:hypothetical protein GCM10011504_57650 [Siccirubricoccus deserti]|nr:hypothetical protein GCM10011504_57650 [Siccirubricoccus deserti]
MSVHVAPARRHPQRTPEAVTEEGEIVTGMEAGRQYAIGCGGGAWFNKQRPFESRRTPSAIVV